MTKAGEVESFLRMAGRAAALADGASDPWLKAEWREVARACKNVARARMNGTLVRRSGLTERDGTEGGKGDE